MRPPSAIAFLATMLALAACSQEPAALTGEADRFPIAQVDAPAHEPLPSPDTAKADWTVDQDGTAIHFGDADRPPYLSLDCLMGDGPSQLVVIRHASALPGQKALFPVYGNGVRSRFFANATLRDEEWRWEAAMRADDPQLDVFLGPRELKATLPGKGMLEIAGSRIPGEFVEWCRAGGRIGEIAGSETSALPQPVR